MRKTLLSAILLLWAAMLYSQDFQIEAGSGAGFYKMENLKALNTYVMKDLGFNTKLTDDFPAWVYFKGALLFGTENYMAGFALSHHSTGSRISAQDYSGSYHFDNIINAWMPGILIKVPLGNIGKVELEGQLEAGFIYSKLMSTEYLELFDTVYLDNTYNFKAMNLYVEPILKISYPVKSFKISCQISYMSQFGKEGFKLDQQGNPQVMNPGTNTVLKPEWSGLRMNFSILYPLDKLFLPVMKEKKGTN
ncbi:MAG: hypothetical protein IPH88_05565 [Bacteroidales bacterium]|nr:hypothetical protein [Bacteroidales bacterium]